MSADPTQRARIVVVDDDRFTRELVRETLESQGRIEVVASAEAALEALQREAADLVVSDLTMPGRSGIELLERVRRMHPGTEFVLLTAHASVETAVQALRLGAADYLSKPVHADELALTVERILSRLQLLKENRRLRDTVQTLEAGQTLARSLDAGEVYALALDLLLHACSRTRGMALFRRDAIPRSDGVAFRGFSEAFARALRDRLVEEKPIDLAAFTGIGVVFQGELHEALARVGAPGGEALCIPLRGRDTEAGAVWLFADGRVFDTEEIGRARLIARQAELALVNAERYGRAKERAFVDDVTEVYNARYLHQATEREIQRAERSGSELCVLFLDLDRFKGVNDRYGHLVGSQALRYLSAVLKNCVRQIDTLARYGGDEFTILLPDTPLAAGLAVAERIRRRVAEELFEAGRETPIRLSISIGVAAYPQHGHDRASLLDAADKAMYRAKSLGRNCVCSASELGRRDP